MNTTLYLRSVSDFHRAMLHCQPEPVAPVMDNLFTNVLRPELMREEIHELREAIRVNNRVETLDALCDIQYVLSGSVIDWGLRPMFENTPGTISLRKIHDMDAHIAAMLGLVNMCKIAAEMGFGLQVFTHLRKLQERVTEAVWHLGFSPVFDEAFKVVHENNMCKLWDAVEVSECADSYSFEQGPFGYIARREDGKIMKPAGFQKVTLERFV